MKKDRNCNCNGGVSPYPIYPNYMPNMPMINPMMQPNMLQPNMLQPNIGNTNQGFGYNQGSSLEQQVYNLNNQVNSLERRVANLEGLVGNTNTQYNTSNYQVM